MDLLGVWLWRMPGPSAEGHTECPMPVPGMPFGGLGVTDCLPCHKAFDFHRPVCTHVGILGGLAIEHN